jgi:hypothetical protein
MPSEADSLGQKLFRRATALAEKRRYIFDSVVQQLYQYFMPDLSDVNTEKTEGIADWFQDVYDSAPIRAVSTCSVGIRNWVTPSTEPWLGLSPPPNLPKQAQPLSARGQRLSQPPGGLVDDQGMDDASRWCDEEAAGMLQDLSSSNFYAIIQPFNKAACVSGTALMFCEEGKAEALKFEQFKFGTFAIAENDQKIVDTVFRWFKLTVRQACQRWCEKDESGEYDPSKLPKCMQKDVEKQRYDKEYMFIHSCMPRENFEAMGGEIKGEFSKDMAFASIYMSEIEKTIIDVGGYEENPYFCLRFSRWGTDNQPYGCSPAFETLPEARQLNYVTQFQDALSELKAFPRFIIPDSVTGEVELAAGGATTVRADDMAGGKVPKEWMTEGESGEIIQMLERKENAINKAFFVDTFTALSQLGDKVTESTLGAIALLQGEKLDQFTGTFDQYRTELINPLIRRMLGLRQRAGRSRPAPDSLMVQTSNDPKKPKELAIPKIQIKSRVTLALSEVRNNGLAKTMQMWAGIAEQHPEIWDNINLDNAFRGSSRDLGNNEANLRSWKDMMQIRAKREKMQQEQMALEKAKLASELAKNLGKAPQKMQDAAAGQLEQFQAAQSA